MLWIKRNLVLVATAVITLVLLVLGGLYFSSAVAGNKALQSELEETKAKLTQMYQKDPFPHATNTAKAREQTDRVTSAVAATRKYFTPVTYRSVRGQEFKTLLDNTIYELTRKAEQSGVRLPETNYAFTFKAQKALVKFADGSWPALPEMLADIQAICTLLFDAKCNLRSLRRERPTADDPAGTPDYTELRRETDAVTGMVLVPYEVTVTGFSKNLSILLDTLARSPHGFIVKVLLVEPESGQSPEVKREIKVASVTGQDSVPSARGPGLGRRPPPPTAPEAADNQVVLIEQALRTTLLIKAVHAAETTPAPMTRPGR
jgi:hypothetical protein